MHTNRAWAESSTAAHLNVCHMKIANHGKTNTGFRKPLTGHQWITRGNGGKDSHKKINKNKEKDRKKDVGKLKTFSIVVYVHKIK